MFDFSVLMVIDRKPYFRFRRGEISPCTFFTEDHDDVDDDNDDHDVDDMLLLFNCCRKIGLPSPWYLKYFETFSKCFYSVVLIIVLDNDTIWVTILQN